MRAVLLVDHHNVEWGTCSMENVVTTWMAQGSSTFGSGLLTVRAYGGWYQGNHASEDRFTAVQRYADFCPAILKLAPGVLVRIRFEFADNVVIGSRGTSIRASTEVRETVVERDRAQSLVAKDGTACSEADCRVRDLKRWIRKKRACLSDNCPNDFLSFYSHKQQKQVDVHLATDLLLFCSGIHSVDHIGVMSDDVDFSPALLAAGAMSLISAGGGPSVAVIRQRRTSSYADSNLRAVGVSIIQAASV